MPPALGHVDDLSLPRAQPRVMRERLGCGVCGRSLLTGERAAFYAAPARPAVAVCELCAAVAREHGWTPSEQRWQAPDRLPVDRLH